MARMVIRREFCVLRSSPLIGMKVKELEREYGIKAVHLHDPVQESIEEPAHPKRKIKERFFVKVEGGWENVNRIFRDSFGVYGPCLRPFLPNITFGPNHNTQSKK